MKIRRERHRVWSLSYHAVFVVKYRKPCITDEIADFLLDEMRHLLESWGGELIEGKQIGITCTCCSACRRIRSWQDISD